MNRTRRTVLDRPAFNVLRLPGLAAWYAADRITGIADGGTIAQWDDLSGNGRHATQATEANKPTYQTVEQNGLPGVLFDGTDDFLACDALAALFTGSDVPITAYLVVEQTSVAGVRDIFSMNNSVDGDTLHTLRSNGTAIGVVRRDDAASIVTVEHATDADTSPHVRSYAFSGTSNAVYRDSILRASGSQDVGTLTIDLGTLGARRAAGVGTGFTAGYLHEVIICASAHSDSTRTRTERYLRKKWGTP